MATPQNTARIVQSGAITKGADAIIALIEREKSLVAADARHDFVELDRCFAQFRQSTDHSSAEFTRKLNEAQETISHLREELARVETDARVTREALLVAVQKDSSQGIGGKDAGGDDLVETSSKSADILQQLAEAQLSTVNARAELARAASDARTARGDALRFRQEAQLVEAKLESKEAELKATQANLESFTAKATAERTRQERIYIEIRSRLEKAVVISEKELAAARAYAHTVREDALRAREETMQAKEEIERLTVINKDLRSALKARSPASDRQGHIRSSLSLNHLNDQLDQDERLLAQWQADAQRDTHEIDQRDAQEVMDDGRMGEETCERPAKRNRADEEEVSVIEQIYTPSQLAPIVSGTPAVHNTAGSAVSPTIEPRKDAPGTRPSLITPSTTPIISPATSMSTHNGTVATPFTPSYNASAGPSVASSPVAAKRSVKLTLKLPPKRKRSTDPDERNLK